MIPQRNMACFQVDTFAEEVHDRHEDQVAVEEPLEIRLTHQGQTHQLAITMRTPGEDFQLAAGFFVSEGLVRELSDIEKMSYCLGPDKAEQNYNIINVRLRSHVPFNPARFQRNFYTTSSCGICGKASLEALEIQDPPIISALAPVSNQILYGLVNTLKNAQSIFEKTGGLHAAALFNVQGQLLGLREDVGRHNAVDKVIGEQFLAEKLPLSKHILLVSGRASFEILQKAVMAGIPMIASIGAPSSLAVETAQKFNQTLIGFLSAGRFNVYAGNV